MMATKSGKVRVKDCRNGKTFYMVKIIVDSVGSFATVIEPVYCCGVSKEEFFLLSHVGPTGSKKYVCDYRAKYFNASLSGRDHVIRRLFVSRRKANRFIKLVTPSFRPSFEQMWSASYSDRLINDIIALRIF